MEVCTNQKCIICLHCNNLNDGKGIFLEIFGVKIYFWLPVYNPVGPTNHVHSFIHLRCKIRLYMQKYNTITNTITSISRHNNTYKYIICLVRKGMEMLYCHPCWSIQILFPFCHRIKNKASYIAYHLRVFIR